MRQKSTKRFYMAEKCQLVISRIEVRCIGVMYTMLLLAYRIKVFYLLSSKKAKTDIVLLLQTN